MAPHSLRSFMDTPTFVEYCGGEWVEVCGRRKYEETNFPAVHKIEDRDYIPVARRRDPERYRMNDNDGFLYELDGAL